MVFLFVALLQGILFLAVFLIWQSDNTGPLGHVRYEYKEARRFDIKGGILGYQIVVTNPLDELVVYRSAEREVRTLAVNGQVIRNHPVPPDVFVEDGFGISVLFGKTPTGEDRLIVYHMESNISPQIVALHYVNGVLDPTALPFPPNVTTDLYPMGSDGVSSYWFMVITGESVGMIYEYDDGWVYKRTIQVPWSNCELSGLVAYSGLVAPNERLYVVAGRNYYMLAEENRDMVFVGVNTEDPVARLLPFDIGAALVTFGSSVAISDDGSTVAVGGDLKEENLNVVWLYRRGADYATWLPDAKLIGSDQLGDYDYRQSEVSLSGDGNTVIVGSPFDGISSDEPIAQGGAVWVFRRDSSGKWKQLRAPLRLGDPYVYFGYKVVVSKSGEYFMAPAWDYGNGTGVVVQYRLI